MEDRGEKISKLVGQARSANIQIIQVPERKRKQTRKNKEAIK